MRVTLWLSHGYKEGYLPEFSATSIDRTCMMVRDLRVIQNSYVFRSCFGNIKFAWPFGILTFCVWMELYKDIAYVPITEYGVRS